MKNKLKKNQLIVSIFPLSSKNIAVIFAAPLRASTLVSKLFKLESGAKVKSIKINESNLRRVVLTIQRTREKRIEIDNLLINSITFENGKTFKNVISPKFIHDVQDPMSLKVPFVSEDFPFETKLKGIHVSVACCTGCNGGVHDRNLVVLNHHIGGAWSGIWIKTAKTIDMPYPRWLKVLCAGGVIEEINGSTTVVDNGNMEIYKLPEVPHHAPPALPIETIEVPIKSTNSLVSKSLDGSWVQFEDIQIVTSQFFKPLLKNKETINLARNQITFKDKSGGQTMAFLYQPTGQKVKSGMQLKMLRGFIHAESEGIYVLLSDKEEDICL